MGKLYIDTISIVFKYMQWTVTRYFIRCSVISSFQVVGYHVVIFHKFTDIDVHIFPVIANCRLTLVNTILKGSLIPSRGHTAHVKM